MRAVIQRVKRARVTVEGEVVSRIDAGLLVLLGVAEGDAEADADRLAEKVANLRIFADEAGKMNLSVRDVGGAVLAVSQFTLLADCRKGRRPSFIGACEPKRANDLYLYFCRRLAEGGLTVGRGRFQTTMDVELVNAGPVTIILESPKTVPRDRRGRRLDG